jgi:hypothetical protein
VVVYIIALCSSLNTTTFCFLHVCSILTETRHIAKFDTRRILTILVSQVAETAVTLAIHMGEQIVTRAEEYARHMMYLAVLSLCEAKGIIERDRVVLLKGVNGTGCKSSVPHRKLHGYR